MEHNKDLPSTSRCEDNDPYGSDTTEELIIVPVDPLDIGSPTSVSDPDLIIDDDASPPPNLLPRKDSPQAHSTSTVRNAFSCENCKLKTFAAQTAGQSQRIRD